MANERATVSNKEGKKKMYPLTRLNVVGGTEGGIGGLLVFGGALAVASFMAVASFASNKNKAKGKGKGTHDRQSKPKPRQLMLNEECKSTEDDNETTQSLTPLLQHSTTQDRDNTCSCSTSNMSINQCNSSELLPAQAFVPEEKIDQPNHEEETPTCFLPQEVAFSDYSHPESAASSNENGVVEDCLVSLMKSSTDKALEDDKDEPPCGLKSIENENGDVNDCLVSLLKSFSDKSLEDKDDPQYGLKSTETESEDEDRDYDGESDDVLGSGEEDTSKATGSTSLDYNEEPVWPAELIQVPEQEFKGDYCDTHAYSERDADGSDYAGNDKATVVTKEEATLNQIEDLLCDHQPSELRTRVIPMLLLALLLLLVLLTRRPQESFQGMDEIA